MILERGTSRSREQHETQIKHGEDAKGLFIL